MRALIAVVLLAYAGALLAHADGIVCVHPGPRPTKHLLFVIDTSGSMVGDSLAKAVGAVEMVAGQPLDAGEFAVLAFSGRTKRWTYRGRTWTPLPNARAVREATKWLRADIGGSTDLEAALVVALAEPKRDMTIIVVSDGIVAAPGAAVEAAQKRRAKRHGRAMIMCLGIGSSPTYVGSRSVLARVAKAGGGACYRTP